MSQILNLPQPLPQHSAANLIVTQTGITLDTGKMEIVLQKPKLTQRGLLAAGDKLRKSFPAVNEQWLSSFFEEIKNEGYSDEELMAVVSKVVREETFTGYPPAIAKFLGHGRRVKLFTMHDIDRLVQDGKEKYQNFGLIQRKEGKAPCAFFARRTDLRENGITELEPGRL